MRRLNKQVSARSILATSAAGVVLLSSALAAGAAGTLALSDHGGAQRNHGDRSSSVSHSVDGGHAKNVILLIGDGMGDSEITSARNYQFGADGRFPGIDAFPLTGQYTTFSLTKDGKPDYVTDSAASGTGWATGTKTYDNAISVDIKGKPHQTLLELAKKRGLKTGNVTTAEIEDATPAVLASHISARSCYGPVVTSTKCSAEALENGGLGSIAEQFLNTRADVTLGGGAKTFAETAKAGTWKDKTLLEQATARGYQVVNDKGGLGSIATADQKQPVLGLFAPGNMPVRWTGPAATNNGGTEPAARCVDNSKRPSTQPSLADMTNKAIDLLKANHKLAASNKEAGFFLQVEGASIDKQDHAADACGQIGEVVDLDEAVQSALAFAKKDGNTSVFLTADHGHTSQIVEAGGNTPGISVTLETNEGSPMTLSYGTAPSGGSQQHTGTQVRIAGYGPQAANIEGLTDQTDLFFTISRALNLPSPSK